MNIEQIGADRNCILLAGLTHTNALDLARAYVQQLDGNSDGIPGQILWQLCKEYDTIVPEEIVQYLAASWREVQKTDVIVKASKNKLKPLV